MSDPQHPKRDSSSSCRGNKKIKSKPLQNKKRKLKKFKGTPLPKGKKPQKY